MRLGHSRRRGAVDEEAFLPRAAVRPLGDAHQGDIAEAELRQHLVDGPDLPETAVDQQQIRCRNLPFAYARIATLERLAQRAIIITWRHAVDVEATVFLLERPLRAE